MTILKPVKKERENENYKEIIVRLVVWLKSSNGKIKITKKL